MNKKNVFIGIIGPVLDQGEGEKRWERWRPTVALCQQEDLLMDRFELFYERNYLKLAEQIKEDIQLVSPETKTILNQITFRDAWNFEDVFNALLDFTESYNFNPDQENYFIHITTGTHVFQICLFLLTEARYFPGKLVQTSPPKRKHEDTTGTYTVIDLDLSRYDKIAQRFSKRQTEGLSFLKAGIETKNKSFNILIEEIEQIAIHSNAPLLLMGPTGAGKSSLARRIFELKKQKGQIEGGFVEINCATLKGDVAGSTLFGHRKGAFTGAHQDRPGLLKESDKGVLFLDEIAELGLDEQAMLLKAIEEKQFLPLGSDKEIKSNFQLIAGSNRDLQQEVLKGVFREDLLSRINLWSFHLPALKNRLEDIEANIEYELQKYSNTFGKKVTFNKEARDRYLKFARSSKALWKANFRDLNASITRMATLSPQGRINDQTVIKEILRLEQLWNIPAFQQHDILKNYLSEENLKELDLIEQIQLSEVIKICKQANSLSQAGRMLFAASRERKKTQNDSDRLRKYLSKYSLDWKDLK